MTTSTCSAQVDESGHFVELARRLRVFQWALGKSEALEPLVGEAAVDNLIDRFIVPDQLRPSTSRLRLMWRGCCLDAFRRVGTQRDRTVRAEIDVFEAPSGAPEDPCVSHETSRAVYQALMKLDDRERKLLYLRYFEGEPLATIAGVLSVNESSIRTLHWRALGKLRNNPALTCM